ncbi:MAG: 4-hydroxy-3-methylbut-2-enyl diphosphate reductase [Fibrobacteraceae bacterium]|nr:4-hydroxy-3-methylbut-2-enyl diphosphate reductase [Fibrobacteraceae bacterium]
MKQLYLANPRGFCAGVDRAIHIVDGALQKFGAPIYVRHEIVHNFFVVDRLRAKGAIFVEELNQIPENSTVIFSAHGVAESVYKEAETRHLRVLDATCPLVKRVHSSAKRHFDAGRHIILIGHSGHAEVEGTLGQLPRGAITVIRNVSDVETLSFENEELLAYITQTTLSVAETKNIIRALHSRFPKILGPERGDLCYATGNRQAAVSEICSKVQLLLVVGAKNSSNSSRLSELGTEHGILSRLIASVADLKLEWFDGIDSVGLSSGASAPEDLVQEVVAWMQWKFPEVEVINWVTMREQVKFQLPPELST